MAGLVPAIHAASKMGRRGWPGQATLNGTEEFNMRSDGIFRVLARGLAFACALSIAPARAADTVIVGTVGSASANLWPVFIGLNKGFFTEKDIKIDLVYVQSSAAVIQQLTAGSLEVTMSTGLVDPIRAVEKGAPLAIVR